MLDLRVCTVNSTILWDLTQCRPVEDHRNIRETYSLHLKGRTQQVSNKKQATSTALGHGVSFQKTVVFMYTFAESHSTYITETFVVLQPFRLDVLETYQNLHGCNNVARSCSSPPRETLCGESRYK